MNGKTMFVSFTILCACLLHTGVFCDQPSSGAEPAPASADATANHFSSVAGGLATDLPSGWRAVEFPGKDIYRCTLSPDKIVKEDDPISVGIRIERTADYTRGLGLEKGDPLTVAVSHLIFLGTKSIVAQGKSPIVTVLDPDTLAADYPAAVAKSRAGAPNGGQGLPAVVLARVEPAKGLAGMDTFEYDVFTDYGSSDCSYHRVVIGIKKKQLITLDRFVRDCSNRVSSLATMESVVGSLRLESLPR